MTDRPGSYFEREGARVFRATRLTEGAWNPAEQHIAPALGLVAHAIEADMRERRGADALVVSRVSYDILGVVPIGVVTVETSVLRPGRTIELVEARLLYDGRPVVLARAWLLKAFDASSIAGTALTPLAPPEGLPDHAFDGSWAGACVASIEGRREPLGQGRARGWIRTPHALIGGESVSGTAWALGMVDFANGITPRFRPDEAFFPNVDLTAHLLRVPAPGWLGFDTSVTFDAGGIGLTHSILHDANGPLGSVAQSLTVRPR